MPLFFDGSQRSLRTRDGSKYNSLFAGADSALWPFDAGGAEPLNPSDDNSVFLQPLPGKEEVLRFFLLSDESDATWVLDGVMSDRPELLQLHHARVSPRLSMKHEAKQLDAGLRKSEVFFSTSESDNVTTLAKVRRQARQSKTSMDSYLANIRVHTSITQELKAEISTSRKSEAQQELQRRRVHVSDPLVQFSSFMYYHSEDDRHTKLEVVRIGNIKTRSEVHYETVDATGMASHKFQHQSGKLVFEAGEDKKHIFVNLIDDDMWGTTTEFHVQLKREGLVGAVLGKYLWHTRVIITDDETFPTSRYKEQILANQIEEIPKFGLLMEYCRMNWNSKPGIRIGTFKMLLVEQVHNLSLMLRLLTNIFLVDFVLKPTADEDLLFFTHDRTAWLSIISLSFLVQCAVLHVADYKKLGWKVPGLSRHTLQAALLTKFLNYDETSRLQFRYGDLVLAVTRDSDRLVNMGYMGFLALSQNCGQFIILVTLRLALVFARRSSINSAGVGIAMVLLVPLFKVPFLMWRRKTNTTVLDLQHRMQNELAHHIEQTVQNYRLIADYNRRPYFVDKFNDRIQEYNSTALTAAEARLNNHYFGVWLTTCLVATYTLLGGVHVLHDLLTLGTFLADIHIFTQIGDAWSKIFHIFLDMQLVMPDLVRMVTFLNLPIDVPHKMRLHRINEKISKQMLSETVSSSLDEIPYDWLPIVVENIEFKFNAKMVKDAIDAPRLGKMSGSINIQQGHHVSLVGPRGEGKSTLLKIIGGVNLAIATSPDTQFFVPAHLRVLHVSTEPMFFHGTLLENIIFGVYPGDPDGDIKRVIAICERVGLPKHIQKLMQEEEIHSWEDLSQTQKHLLNIARALTSNPEVMCIHKPVQVFDKKHSLKILSLMKEFVTQKGIEQAEIEEHYRRPRTCIGTSSTMLGVELADVVYHVSHAGGIQEMLKDQVSTDMLG